MFNWIKSELEELKKLSSKKKTRMKDEQIIEAEKYFYRPSVDVDLVEAGKKFPLLSAEEILVIKMEASKSFNDEFNRNLEARRLEDASKKQVTNKINKYGNASIGYGTFGVGCEAVGQISNMKYGNLTLTPSQAYRDLDVPRFSIEIKKRDGQTLSLSDKKDLVAQLREIESRVMNQIREEEKRAGSEVVKNKRRKLI